MFDLYRDVFRSLNDQQARYLVIGGVAVGIHGISRATFDLDLLIEATADNARRVLRALTDAGMGTATLTTPDQLLANEITILRDVVQIDIQTRTPGIVFQDAWERRVRLDYRDVPMQVVSRDDLIASKRASGRPVDLEDLRALEADQRHTDE